MKTSSQKTSQVSSFQKFAAKTVKQEQQQQIKGGTGETLPIFP